MKRTCLFVLVSALVATSTALAVDYLNWTGSKDTNFADSANWSGTPDGTQNLWIRTTNGFTNDPVIDTDTSQYFIPYGVGVSGPTTLTIKSGARYTGSSSGRFVSGSTAAGWTINVEEGAYVDQEGWTQFCRNYTGTVNIAGHWYTAGRFDMGVNDPNGVGDVNIKSTGTLEARGTAFLLFYPDDRIVMSLGAKIIRPGDKTTELQHYIDGTTYVSGPSVCNGRIVIDPFAPAGSSFDLEYDGSDTTLTVVAPPGYSISNAAPVGDLDQMPTQFTFTGGAEIEEHIIYVDEDSGDVTAVSYVPAAYNTWETDPATGVSCYKTTGATVSAPIPDSAWKVDFSYYWKVNEVDLTNNMTYPGQVFSFKTPEADADINQDGFVNIEDFAALGHYWQNDTPSNLPGWLANVDIYRDGIVDLYDLECLSKDWMKYQEQPFNGNFIFYPTDDTYVRQEYPAGNNGTDSVLRVRGDATGKQIISYLKFKVSGIASPITGALLKLRSQVSLNDVEIWLVDDNAWTEDSMTWNNKPALTSRFVTKSGISANNWYTFDVSSYITSNHTYTLAIVSTDDAAALDFCSKESDYQPVLEATTATPDTNKHACLFAGGELYKNGYTSNASAVKSSGLDTVFVWSMKVASGGTINLNSDTLPIAQNGEYVGDKNWPAQLKDLRTAPSTVKRVEASVGAWGNTSFENIEALIASQGTGKDSILYKNFKVLRDVLGIDAINFDDESNYDSASTVEFSKMLSTLGFKVTFCPYTATNFWSTVYNELEAYQPGLVDRVYLICYAGGVNNTPSAWAGYFPNAEMIPGLSVNEDTAAQMQQQFSAWKNGIDGGFIWSLYLIIQNYGLDGVGPYVNAVINGVN